MAALTVSAISAAVGVAGLAAQGVSAWGQKKERQNVTEASIRAEDLREQQMNLEAQRLTRQKIREAQVANSLSLARSVNQGAGVGSSALFGAYGQTQGELGRSLVGIRENQDIGAGIFDANRDIAQGQGQIAMWEGFGKLGTTITSQASNVGRIFGSYPGNAPLRPEIGPWQTNVFPAPTAGTDNPNTRFSSWP